MISRYLWIALGGAGSLAVWAVVSHILGPGLVPAPGDILVRLVAMIAGENLALQAALTWVRSLTAALVALCLGVVLGNLLGRDRRLEDLGFIPLTVLQGTPPLVWTVPLVVLLFSTRELVPAAVVFLVVLPLGIINVQNARKALTGEKEDIFRIYAPGSRRLRWQELHLPHLIPALRASLQLGLVLGLKSSIVGEWVAGQDGLGRLMNSSYILFDLKTFLAVTMVFLTLVFFTSLAGTLIADRLMPLRRPTGSGHFWTISRIQGKKPSPLSPLPSNPVLNQGLFMKNVQFSYPRSPGIKNGNSATRVFEDLNLEILPGETVVLSGNSGEGKTTLARLALGLKQPQAGAIRWPARPGCLFQEDALLAHRDALGNVCLPLWARKEDRWEDLGRDYLEMVGLGDRETSFPGELSGGQRKRLAFARALALDPGFMVLDEPFHNLHREARTELWDLYWKLFPERGLTSLIITHYPEELSGRKVRFLELKEGILQTPEGNHGLS